MNPHTVPSRRPASLWGAAALLAVLAFLSAVGGFVFNLSGADGAGEVLVGLVFVALAAGYLLAALRLLAGDARFRALALGLVTLHGLFNAIVKVGIEGETESAMFVVLALVVAVLLVLPATRIFLATRSRSAA